VAGGEGGSSIFGRVRGFVALLLEALVFVTADVVQRTLVVIIVKGRPAARDRVLTAWARMVNGTVLWVFRVAAGASVRIAARIPFAAGTLVLMNHQSLLDIPVALESVAGGYPLIVARERYARGYPLISHMIRLYGHPTVRPGEHAGAQLESLQKVTRETVRPVVIYPEGTRSRDGGIRPFKKAGLKAILMTRPWSVHVLVGDGMWGMAGLRDFVHNVGSARVRAESLGPFPFDPARDDVDAFIGSMEAAMTRKLAEMRGCGAEN
jgi:1-acyl-sn-glycerol-3-phosphate acyltransferase